jgi:hypothetical protein
MSPQKQYRCRFCGTRLNAWLPAAQAVDGAMLLCHLSQQHPDQAGSYLECMRTEYIATVAAEGFEQLEEEVMASSGHALLPHLKVLQQHFLEPLTLKDNDERFRSTYFDLELLPYAMGAT